MNIGNIVTQALLRADLSVFDYKLRQLATQMLDEQIQFLYEMEEWWFRKSLFSITFLNNIEEYALDKLTSGCQGMLPNSFRGSNPVRRIVYEPAMEHYRKRAFVAQNANPYYYREGDVRGYAIQVSAASNITFVSSLTSTTGNVAVTYGSRRIIFAAPTVNINSLGMSISFAGDVGKYYQITSLDTAQSYTIAFLSEPYQGATSAALAFTLGDIGMKACVSGYDTSNAFVEEQIILQGSTAVTTATVFSAIDRVTKTAQTYGRVTATSNGGLITNAVLDPGETEVDYQTIKVYPIPAQDQELATYENYIRHPHMVNPSSVPLIPSQYHQLLVLQLYIKLMTEWNKKEVSQETIVQRDAFLQRMITINNNTDNWKMQQETEYDSTRSRISNLPVNFGISDGYEFESG